MFAANTASMLPRPSPCYYSMHGDAPPAQYHAYSTPSGFLAGSTQYSHEAQFLSTPTNLVGARGSISTTSGYGYTFFDYSPMPFLPNPPPESVPRMDINQPRMRMSSLEYSLISSSSPLQTMAISASYPPSPTTIDPNTASTTRSGSEYRRGSEKSPAGGSSPRRRGPAVNKEDNSGDSKEKKHPCWMCHKRFDR